MSSQSCTTLVPLNTLVPTGKATGALLVTPVTPQLSWFVGVLNATFVKQELKAVVALRSAFVPRNGGCVSNTTTRCELLAVLP